MKRSEINQIVADAADFIEQFRFKLPPFADWDLATWQANKEVATHLIDAGLGWDVTDHGTGDFAGGGLVLFTLRNGHPTGRPEGYTEKLIISQVDQVIPFHYHKLKTEDIINRGGGLFKIELFNATPDGKLADSDILVYVDGMPQICAAGTILTLEPGSSIHLPPRLYHRFWAEAGPVLIGEVSTVNDDHGDNYFLEPILRFPSVEEDVSLVRLLVSDYQRWVIQQ